MDISALKQDDYQVWVTFLDAKILIRYVSRSELFAIAKQSTKRSWDRRHQPIEEVDYDESNRSVGRAAVRGWEGITMEGKEFPYTPENCDFLMTRWGEFSRFVNEACIDLQSLVAEERMQKGKKLLSHIRARLDFPGVTCESCRDIEAVDEVLPDCKIGKGCLIPQLGQEEGRILEVRDLLVRLHDLINPEVILKMYEISREEIEMLAAIEDELRKMKKEETKG